MVQFNFSERTIRAKVVYYGPPQSGKTTNLEQIHRITDPEGSNRLISLNTAQDRTLFFDLLPFSLGSISGYDFKIQLYTVPGQVQYNATRRVVLAGADAVVFVADSQKSVARENLTAFENMKVNLLANRLVPEKVPLVLQYNKQDLHPVVTRAELDRALNFWGRRAFAAVASRGEGVMETFLAIVQDMLASIAVRYNLKEKGLDPEAVPEVVASAFERLVRAAPSPASASSPPRVATAGTTEVATASASRLVIAQPAEPAYAGRSTPDANPVSEELLQRAIRSNVELAEMFGHLVSDMTRGLGRIRAQAETLEAAAEEPARAAAAAIRAESDRLRHRLQQLGLGGAGRGAPSAAEASAAAPSAASPPALAAAAPRPHQPQPVAAAAAAAGALTLDGLLAEVAAGVRATLAARPVTVHSRLAPATPLPRCSPAILRRSLAAVLLGLAGAVAPDSTIAVRAERKPVLLRGRDGRELKRDFLMLAFAHDDGVDGGERQLLEAGDGPLAEGQRRVREMGGFVRLAPLPGGAVETRLFLPL
jgi:signal recognition particle receptor subunit beta